MFDKLWTFFGRGKTEAGATPSEPRACQSSTHSRESGSRYRRSQAGNVFFTLFGAVAVVGVLGAGIMATMRGPLSTMVEVNRIEETKAEMGISLRLVLLKASEQDASGTPDVLTEPLAPASCTSATGAGCIPGTTSAKQKDAWGTAYAYCAWNNGSDHAAIGTMLAGEVSTNNISVALISAGPDRTFQTSCVANPGSGAGFQVISPADGGGDDIVRKYNYNDAAAGSDGLWELQSNAGNDIAAIQEEIKVGGGQSATSTFEGGAQFGNNIGVTNVGGSVTADVLTPVTAAAGSFTEFTHGMLLGDTSTCTDGMLRIHTGVLQRCKSGTWDEVGKSLWVDSGSGGMTTATGYTHVGIGTAATGNALIVNGSTSLGGTLAVTGTNATTLGGTLAVTGNSTLSGTLGVTGATTLSSTLGVTGAAELDSTLGVDGTSEFRGDTTVKSDLFVAVDGGGAKGNLTVQNKITATAGDITATAGNVVATAGNINATAGNVTAGKDITATGKITATTGDITATAGNLVATAGNITATAGNITAGNGTITGKYFHHATDTRDFGNIPDCDADYQKLAWSASGWSCENIDLSGGGVGGPAPTLTSVLTAGEDGGNKDIKNVSHVNADYYCPDGWASNSDCISASTLIQGSAIWKKDGPGAAAGEIYYNGGFVGIGTNDPGQRLEVSNGGLRLQGDKADPVYYTDLTSSYTSQNIFSINMKANAVVNTMMTMTNAVSPTTVFNSGNVGIGAVAPQTKLDVNGTLKIADGAELCTVAAQEGAIRYLAATDKFQVCADNTKGWEDLFQSGNGTGVWKPDDGGKNFIEYDDAKGGMRVGKVSGAAPVQGWTVDAANSIIFTSGKVGASQYCKADGTGCFDPGTIAGTGSQLFWKNDGPGGATKVYYNGGNVGIGTNNPSTALQIDKAGNLLKIGNTSVYPNDYALFNQDGNLTINTSSSAEVLQALNGGRGLRVSPNLGYLTLIGANNGDQTALKLWPNVTDGATAIAYKLNTQQALSNATAKLLSVQNNSVEKFVVLANGYTGILNAAPKAALDIGGTLRIGDGTELCNSVDHEGDIKYDAAGDKFYMCRNSTTGWEELGTGSGGGGGGGSGGSTMVTNFPDALKCNVTGGTPAPASRQVIFYNQFKEASTNTQVYTTEAGANSWQLIFNSDGSWNSAYKNGGITNTTDCDSKTITQLYTANQAFNFVGGSGSGAATPGPSFSVHKNSVDQSIPANTATKLTWSTEAFDTNNNFAGDKFTPTVPGKYMLTATATAMGVDAGGYAWVGIYKNGVLYSTGNIQKTGTTTSDITSVASAVVDANGTTDYFEVYALQSSAAAKNIAGIRTLTSFSGALIGGGGTDTLAGLTCTSGQVAAWNGTAWACSTPAAGGGGSAGPSFSVHKNGTAQTVTANTGTKLTWSTEAFDTNNNFAGDKFSPTVAGKYQFNGAVHCAGGGDCQVLLFKNGVQVSGFGMTNRPSNSYATLSSILDMNGSTDYVELYVNSASTSIGGSSLLTYFNGALIGGGGGGGSDTLAGLTCTSGQVAAWNGTAWACAANGSGGGGGSAAEGLDVNGSTTSIPNNTTTDVVFSAAPVTNNFGSGAWTSNKLFTVPAGKAGWYNITGYASLNSGVNSKMILYIDVNGTSVVGSRDDNPGASTQLVSASTNIYLSAGDAVKLKILQQIGSAASLTGARLSMVKIGGGSDTLAGLTCTSGQVAAWNGTAWACSTPASGGGASASFGLSGTTQSIASGSFVKITTYGTTSTSGLTNSTYSAGEITIGTQDAGWWLLSGFAYNTTASTAYLGVRVTVNGSGVYIQQSENSTGAKYQTASGAAYLAAGDVVALTVLQNSGSADVIDQYKLFGTRIGGGGSGTDTLAGLTCTTGQVAAWNGTAWACSTPAAGGGAGTSMATGWPDAIYCSISTGEKGWLYHTLQTAAGLHRYMGFNTRYIDYNTDGTYNTQGNFGGTPSDCNVSIAAIQTAGRSFNFVGGGSGTDTLAGLTCTSGQVAAWNGTAWACSTVGGTTSYTLIPQNQGTAIGDATSSGGLAAAFDGNNNQSDAQVAYLAATTAWVGKQYTANKTVSRWKAWGANGNIGFNNTPANGAGNLSLQYKDASCTVDTGWTTLDTYNYTTTAAVDRVVAGSSAHLCWRLKNAGNGGDTRYAEVEFYEGTTSGSSLWTDSGAGYLEYSTADAGVKLANIAGMTMPALGLASGMTWDGATSTLSVTGNITYTGTLTDTSDRRLKTDIDSLVKYGSMLDKINEIDTYSFRMCDKDAKDSNGDTMIHCVPGAKTPKEFGVMAQELERVFPNLVHTADDKMGTKSVNYLGLIAPMIEATKELSAQNTVLKAEVETLHAARESEHADVEALKQQVALLNKLAAEDAKKASSETLWLAMLAMVALSGLFGLIVLRQRKA